MELQLIGYIKDGKYRLKILEMLGESPYLSSELATKLNISRSSMSRILRNLKEKELVESSSSGSRTILYSITEKGRNVLIEVNDDFS